MVLNLKKLQLYLRPPGKGVYTISAGRKMADTLLKKIYKTSHHYKITLNWKKTFQSIKAAPVILLGCPSDIGAGVVRGANMGPLGLRLFLYEDKKFQRWLREGRILDIGDVFVIPQLLSDEMLTTSQKKKNRHYLYPNQKGDSLPVSPLSILEDVCQIIFSINPKAKIMLLGGDHSLSWPMVKTVHSKKRFSILHIDAHTDLLKSRLGIDHCFGTWAYHANNLIGRKQRLVQVGIRASRKTKSHWERTCRVRQYWAQDILKNPKVALRKIMKHLTSLGLEHVYISNDIDGTGMEYAAATGTPEPKGLSPSFISNLIHETAKRFDIIGADIVEVAPVLHLNKRGEPGRTLKIGCQYTLDMIEAMLERL